MSIAPWLLYRAMLPPVARLLAEGHRFDAIDAHYLYPDGVAAVWLGRRFGLPVVITARGTDVNLIPRYAMPRRLIQGAIRDAGALIAVSAALKQALVAAWGAGRQGDGAAQRRGNRPVPPTGRPRRRARRAGVDGPSADLGGKPDRAQGPSPDDRGDAPACRASHC